MIGPMEFIIILGGLSILVIFITLVVFGVLKLVKGIKSSSSTSQE